LTCSILGEQALSVLGTVIGGPTNSNDFNWWNINYDSGVDGWSVEDYLVKYKLSPPIPDNNLPLKITQAIGTNITSTSANITWTTSKLSDSQVEYGLTTNYGLLTTVNAVSVTNHSVLLSSLSPATLYHFRVKY
jgi:hypothetical protein